MCEDVLAKWHPEEVMELYNLFDGAEWHLGTWQCLCQCQKSVDNRCLRISLDGRFKCEATGTEGDLAGLIVHITGAERYQAITVLETLK